jgi:hypothetical protein
MPYASSTSDTDKQQQRFGLMGALAPLEIWVCWKRRSLLISLAKAIDETLKQGFIAHSVNILARAC